MGKSKNKKKGSGIDWEEFVSAGTANDDGGGWNTGPASMALDDGDQADGDAGVPSGAAAMDDGNAPPQAAGSKKKRKNGRGRAAGGGGAEAMDTSDHPSGGGRSFKKLGVNKGGGMKVSAKRGKRTSAQLKRRMAQQEKALANAEKLEARATNKMGARQKKAALKTVY